MTSPAAAQVPPAVPKAECRASDRVEPGLQGQVPQAERVSGAAVDGYWCNLDLLGSQGRPAAADGSSISAWASMDTYKHCAYYNDSTGAESAEVPKGTVVVDLSDPANPRQTDYLTTDAMQATWESLRVHAGRGLLVADRDGSQFLDIYDVSEDCTKPKLLFAGEMPDAVGHEGFFSPDGMTYWMSGLDPVYPIDLTDPRKPKQLEEPEFSKTGWFHGGSVSPDGKRVYLCETPPGAAGWAYEESWLTIADSAAIQRRVPGPSNEIAMVRLRSNGGCQATYPLFYDGHPYVLQFGEASIEHCPAVTYAAFGFPRMVDIADETKPRVVSELRLEVSQPENCALTAPDQLTTFPDQNAVTLGAVLGYSDHHCSPDRLYNPTLLACGSFMAGLRVFDIRDPLKPTEIAYYSMGTHSAENQTPDHAVSRPVILRERGLVVWTTYLAGLHIARFAPGVLSDAGCGSRDDYYFAHYNPESLCLPKPVPPAEARCTGSRNLSLRLPRKLKSVRIYVNGRRALVLRGKAVRRRVTLRGVKPAKRVRVKIVGKTRVGKRYSKTRVYNTCTKRMKR